MFTLEHFLAICTGVLGGLVWFFGNGLIFFSFEFNNNNKNLFLFNFKEEEEEKSLGLLLAVL